MLKKILFLLSVTSISLNPFIKTFAQTYEDSCLSTSLENFSCLLIDNFDTGVGTSGIESTVINSPSTIYSLPQEADPNQTLGGLRTYTLSNVRNNTDFIDASISTNIPNGSLSWSNDDGVLSNGSVGWIIPDNISFDEIDDGDTIVIKTNTIDLNAQLAVEFKTYLREENINDVSFPELKQELCTEINEPFSEDLYDEVYGGSILCNKFGTTQTSAISDNSLIELSFEEDIMGSSTFDLNFPGFGFNVFNVIEISLSSTTSSVDASIDYIEFRRENITITSTSEPRTFIGLLILTFLALPRIIHHFR
ncbi:MAG: hypothetical protein QNJ42_20415 [Crocosphaera sp.]|nr:hypothetical protein [Crocosphaera sp.]